MKTLKEIFINLVSIEKGINEKDLHSLRKFNFGLHSVSKILIYETEEKNAAYLDDDLNLKFNFNEAFSTVYSSAGGAKYKISRTKSNYEPYYSVYNYYRDTIDKAKIIYSKERLEEKYPVKNIKEKRSKI